MKSWLIPMAAGFGAGILSAWGVGGGTLLLLVMTLILGVPQQQAAAVNLLYFLPTAAMGLLYHRKNGLLERPVLRAAAPWGTAAAAAGALLILACQWGLYLEASALRNAYHLLVLNGTVPYVASVTAAGVCRQQGTAEGFYRLCSKPDPARRWQNYALPLVLATAAVLSGVVCFSGGNMSDFPWVLTALTTAGAGFGIPLSGALPMYYLSRRLSRSGCAAAGYAGAKAVSRPRRLVLTDDDLFPAGTVTLNGYKVFGEERSRAVSYAASVARAADSRLQAALPAMRLTF